MASLGDCRAVLCRAGKPEVLTCEHSVTLESERRRVLREGGTVEAGRLSGFLQVYTYMYIYIYIYVYIYIVSVCEDACVFVRMLSKTCLMERISVISYSVVPSLTMSPSSLP